MSANLSSVPKLQFFDNNGNPLVGGKLYTYEAGTTTPLATFTDSTGLTPNTNPIILDSRGEANVWLGTQAYKFQLKTAADALIWTVDNVRNALSFAQVLAASGTAAAPAYSFEDDSSTGVYLNGVGVLGLSANGVAVILATGVDVTVKQNLIVEGDTTVEQKLTLEDIVAAPNGTAAAPSYTFENDLTTGVYLPAVGQIGLAADGVLALSASDTLVTLEHDLLLKRATKETVYALSGTTPAIDPSNGGIQTWTLSANSSPTDSLASGEAVLLMIDDGSARTITWPSVTWKTNFGAAPVLNTSGFTAVLLWKVSTTLYGARVGSA